MSPSRAVLPAMSPETSWAFFIGFRFAVSDMLFHYADLIARCFQATCRPPAFRFQDIFHGVRERAIRPSAAGVPRQGFFAPAIRRIRRRNFSVLDVWHVFKLVASPSRLSPFPHLMNRKMMMLDIKFNAMSVRTYARVVYENYQWKNRL